MGVSAKDLETFIVECQPKLEDIKRSLNAFNIFNVLGVQYREIRHSNFLGWLFDPNESHQLGDIFLKDLLKLIRKIDAIAPEKLVNLLLNDLSGTSVFRETVHNIDILIVNEELGIIICIENKIRSGYSPHQLRKYYNYVEDIYASIPTKVYLTLTPLKSDSHENLEEGINYNNINYDDIVEVLKMNLIKINTALPTVRESINQYINMAEKDILHRSNEVKLAHEIYQKYKKELNFIMSSRPNLSNFNNELWNYIENGKLEGFHLSHQLNKSRIIRILPNNEEILKIFSHPEFNCWQGEYIFSLEIFTETNLVWIKWCFGNIHNAEKHKELQEVKTEIFNKMNSFSCLNKPGVNKHNSRPTSDYPAICGYKLFNEEDFINEGKSMMDLFLERFKKAKIEIINPWIEECLLKLTNIEETNE